MFMSDVDRSDQMRTEYSTARSCRHDFGGFWFLVDLSVSNSFSLMNELPNHQQLDERGRNKKTMLFFRQQLAKQLMPGYREGKKRKRSVPPEKDLFRLWRWTLATQARKEKRLCKARLDW